MTNYKIKNRQQKNQELILEIEIPKSFLNDFRSASIKSLGREIEVKGFRKGMAPEKIIAEKIGEMKILEEEAHHAVHQILPEIMANEKIEALTSPQIAITKIAIGSDMEFKASFILMPKIEPADYKKVSAKVPAIKEVEITEKEINEQIELIRKNYAAHEARKKNSSDADNATADNLAANTATAKKKNANPETDTTLPEFNDEFVKKIGNFKDVADFKKQLAEGIRRDKENREKNRRRTQIIEAIISESVIDLPDILIEEEKNRMMNQYRSDISGLGLEFDKYLEQIKKSEQDLRKEWHSDAVKRAKMNLILPKIAQKEKISVEKELVDHEVSHLMKHHKDIDERHARLYVSHILTNEKVLSFLENIK